MKQVLNPRRRAFALISFLLLSLYACKGQAGWLFTTPEELLAKAAEDGNIPLARKALAKGAHVNARVRYWEDDTWTPLLIAVKKGHIPETDQETRGDIEREYVEVARLLIEHGADVNVKTSYEITPLMNAVGNAEMLELLLNHGADVHATDDKGMTALAHAAQSGRYHTAMLLIKHGADITVETDSGETLLILASGGGNPRLAKYLLDHGLNVNAKTQGGWTALMKAANRGGMDVDVVRLLLEHGADPETRTSWDGSTALIMAASGWPDMTELLLKYGANVNTTSDTGWTALLETAEQGNTAVARVLLEHGADVQGEVGQDVLWRHIHWGMRCEPEFIKLLSEYGVEVTTEDRCGE